MKIAFVDDGIYAYAARSSSAVGGAERDQWLLARALVKAGWSATVGVRNTLPAGERQRLDGVDYVGIGQGPVLSAWRKFLVSEQPDWLLRECACHWWGPLVEIAKFAGVKTIFHAACDLDVNPRHAPLYRPQWWPIYYWGLWRTDRIIVQHSGQLAALPRDWRSKAHILPKVCDIDVSTQPAGHSNRGQYVAWVGTLVRLKRPDVLVQIAASLPSIRFLVCGGIPGRHTDSAVYAEGVVDRLRALSNVEYLGQVAPKRAAQVIADAAILLSTSDVEGFPNTFVQAWSSGTPVVSVTIDPDNIIERMRLGAVVGSADRAVHEIAALMSAPDQRDEIAARAMAFVRENYGSRRVVGLFNRVVNGAS